MALRLVLRLRPGALLSLGPPCGSFVWCNLATSLRTVLRPLGNVDLPHVVLGNVFLGLKLFCMNKSSEKNSLGIPKCQTVLNIIEAHGQSSLLGLGGHSQRMLLGLGAALHFNGSFLSNDGARKSYDYWICHALLLPPILVTSLQLSVWQIGSYLTIIQELCHSLPSWMGSWGSRSAKPSAAWGIQPYAQVTE